MANVLGLPVPHSSSDLHSPETLRTCLLGRATSSASNKTGTEQFIRPGNWAPVPGAGKFPFQRPASGSVCKGDPCWFNFKTIMITNPFKIGVPDALLLVVGYTLAPYCLLLPTSPGPGFLRLAQRFPQGHRIWRLGGWSHRCDPLL